ncbi:hypothetical protein G9A89_013089 [Geosiphon pyriformis]|nr:hypothetical protein G9A89_013089 [Geosiphon pyriformis]
MYQQAPPTYSNYYPQQATGSPPPLQHPIPTHPPIQMRDPPVGSPSPSTQLRIIHPSQQIQPDLQDVWNLNDSTAQMGMQFGKTAMRAGSQYVEKNINRYVDFPALKHYFKVNNSYVANKIRLLLFPWWHKPWSRLVKRSEQNGQMEGFKPPREDINSPDLYIPVMALVTYVLLTGIVAGTEHKFHPEVLGMNATTAFLIVLLDLFFIKTGCYLLNISSETQLLDLMAYSGYKFIGTIVTLIISMIAPFWLVAATFFYTSFSTGFFLLRSLRYVVFPDSTTTVNIPQRKRRINFLFCIAALQVVLVYFLAASSGSMSSKKASKGVFHSSAGGSFSQKKKASLDNVKHSGDEKNISLKSGSSASVYSNVESLSGDDENVSMSGGFNGSLLDSAVNTPKTKHVNTSANFGSPIGFPDFEIDEEVKPLPSPLMKKVFLDKIWIDPKIIKTPVKMAVKKSFALDINFSAVEGKLATAKTQVIRKLFSKINGFGGATTPSKFEEIIRSMFTSEESMRKAVLLAEKEGIIVNNDVRKQELHSNWAVMIKEISMDMPKEMIITTVSEFGQIKSIKIQLSFLIGKNFVCVAKAMGDHDIWAFRDCFRALLFMLPVRTTAHDLSNLLDKTNGRTCIINYSLNTGNRVCCAVVGFESENDLNSTFLTEPVFGGVHLSWARLDLVWCGKCGRLRYSALECNVLDMSSSDLLNNFNKKHALSVDHLQLAKLYAKKNVSISCSAVFGGKLWAQVVSLASLSGGSPSGFGLGAGSSHHMIPDLGGGPLFSTLADSSLNACLASLKCSFELLADQVSNILRKLSFVELVPMVLSSGALLLVGSVPLAPDLDSDMALNGELASSDHHFPSIDMGGGFNLSSLKVLTTKVDGLESKMSALKASIGSLMCWFEFLFTAFIPISSLVWKFATCNVRGINVPAKQDDIVCWHVNLGNMVSFITETKLRFFSGPWIKDKFNGVQIFSSGLDKGFMGAGVAIIMNISLAHHVFKVKEIPGRVVSVWLLFKGKLLVTVLGLYAGASSGARFGQASEVNSLITKTVNSSNFVILGGDFNKSGSGKSASFKFCLSLGLVNSFVNHYLADSHMWNNSKGVGKMIDYIFVGGNLSSAVAGYQVVSVSDFFDTDHRAVVVSVGLGGLLDVQLNSLRKQTNKNCWKFKIKNADCAEWAKFKDLSSAKLLSLGELFSSAKMHGDMDAMWAVLVGAVVNSANVTFSRHWFSEFKCSTNKHSSRFFGLKLLVAKISTLDDAKARAFKDLVGSGVKSDVVVRHLLLVCRDYRRSKMFESKLAEEASVRKVIEKCMDNFCSDKGSMIRSVLEKPFHKVVLDHLIVDDDLVLLPEEVKLSARQYASLNHVQDDAFSGIMSAINMGELLSVVSGLPDDKTAGLSGVVLGCLLVLFNKCLSVGVVPPYDWDGVLINTRPIALIETARKILSKVLSDCISMACNNFSVLKGTSTQSPVFAVGLVIKDAIEKDRKLWLVLQDMRKAYDSVGWHHLRASLWRVKMCERFIRFFGGIYEDRVNRVMTDFGLSGGYKMHDGLDQDEVFLPLLWRIFYNPLLCEVKRHEQLCEYWIDTKFVAKSDRIESSGGLTSYFSAGAFVDDTIWVGNCQASTQYALNIASEFFVINNISINSKKMVAIPINQGVKVALLSICSQPISIAKKGEAHWYLGIFLSTKGLSKPSVAKAYADVRFFVNVVLRKAITDKQFFYLVLAVLQPIVNYHIQFSFVSSNVCHKWNILVRKGLRSKACLSHDFPDTALHHPSLYDLKLFEQVQSEGKVAALIMFSNAFGILGYLFRHRFLDLQVFGWTPLDLLQFPVRLHVSPVNNFLAGMVKIFLGNELSLVNNLPTAFRNPGHFPLSSILGKSLYFDSVKSLRRFGKTFRHWKRLDPCGPVPHWFLVSSEFLKSQGCLFSGSIDSVEKIGLDILESGKFFVVIDGLHDIWSGFFEVFTDGSLRNTGSAEVTCGAAAYFLVLDKSIGITVNGLLSSIMAELQAVTLALECVLFLSTVVLYLDSQAAIDACMSEMSLVAPDFCNQCWLERRHIFNLVRDKDLSVSWVKMKGHSGIPGNVKANLAAGTASGSPFSLCANVCEHFLVAEGVTVSGNAYHFVRNIFRSVCSVRWEAGPDCDVVLDIWHLDSYMLTGFTSWVFSTLRIYIMKAVHRRLLVAVKKRLYDKCYPGVLCLFCNKMEFSDHAFTCVHESGVRGKILAEASAHWLALAGGSPASVMLQVLSQCSIDVGLYTLYEEACSIFEDRKVTATQIVDYVKFMVKLHCAKVWLAKASHRVVMEKTGLVCDSGVVSGLFRGVSLVLSNGVVRLLGVVNSFAVSFGYRKPYCFFSGLGGSVQVIIGV